MIKARGGPVVLLGLSRQNITRLMADQPIRFDGAEVGLPGITFVIMGDETEEAMRRKLQEFITLDTKFDDRWPAGVPRE